MPDGNDKRIFILDSLKKLTFLIMFFSQINMSFIGVMMLKRILSKLKKNQQKIS